MQNILFVDLKCVTVKVTLLSCIVKNSFSSVIVVLVFSDFSLAFFVVFWIVWGTVFLSNGFNVLVSVFIIFGFFAVVYLFSEAFSKVLVAMSFLLSNFSIFDLFITLVSLLEFL